MQVGWEARSVPTDRSDPDDAVDGNDHPTPQPDGSGPTVTTRAPGDDVVHPSGADRAFDWRGYVLLAVMVLALVVAPVLVSLRPPALPWEVTLIVLPLLPALVLGAVAVWATTRP